MDLPRWRRIRRRAEIRRLMRDGEVLKRPGIDLHLLRRHAGGGRIAVVVPRYGHGAVERNRLMRRLREGLRVSGPLWRDHSIDIVVRARRDAYTMNGPELRSALTVLLGGLIFGARAPSREGL